MFKKINFGFGRKKEKTEFTLDELLDESNESLPELDKEKEIPQKDDSSDLDFDLSDIQEDIAGIILDITLSHEERMKFNEQKSLNESRSNLLRVLLNNNENLKKLEKEYKKSFLILQLEIITERLKPLITRGRTLDKKSADGEIDVQNKTRSQNILQEVITLKKEKKKIEQVLKKYELFENTQFSSLILKFLDTFIREGVKYFLNTKRVQLSDKEKKKNEILVEIRNKFLEETFIPEISRFLNHQSNYKNEEDLLNFFKKTLENLNLKDVELEIFGSQDFTTPEKVITELFFLLKSEDKFKDEKIKILESSSLISYKQVEDMKEFILQSKAKRGQEKLELEFIEQVGADFFNKIGRSVSEFTELVLSILKEDGGKWSKAIAKEVFQDLNPILEENKEETVQAIFTTIIKDARSKLKNYIQKNSELDALGKKYFHAEKRHLKESLKNIPNIDELLSQLAESIESERLVPQLKDSFSFSSISMENLPEIELNLKESTFMPVWKMVQHYLSTHITAWGIYEGDEKNPAKKLQNNNFYRKFYVIEKAIKPFMDKIKLKYFHPDIVNKAEEIRKIDSGDSIENIDDILFNISLGIYNYLEGRTEELLRQKSEEEVWSEEKLEKEIRAANHNFRELKVCYQEISNTILSQINNEKYGEIEIPALRESFFLFNLSKEKFFYGIDNGYDMNLTYENKENKNLFKLVLSEKFRPDKRYFLNAVPIKDQTLNIERKLKEGCENEYEIFIFLEVNGEKIHAKRKDSKIYFEGTKGGRIEDFTIREFLSAWDFDINTLKESDENLEQVVLDENFKKSQKYLLEHGILGPAIWEGLYPGIDFKFSKKTIQNLLKEGLQDITKRVSVAVPENFNTETLNQMMDIHNERFPDYKVQIVEFHEDNWMQIRSYQKVFELLNQPFEGVAQTIMKVLLEIREGEHLSTYKYDIMDSRAAIILILSEFIATEGKDIVFEEKSFVTSIIKDKDEIPYTIIIFPKRNKKGGLDLQLSAYRATNEDRFDGMSF